MIKKHKAFFKKHKKKLIAAGVVLALVVVLILLSGGGNGNEETFVVANSDVTEEVAIAGKVQSNDFAQLAFEVTGRITTLSVDIGDEVSRGDILARLDTRALQADLADARANVAIKQANLENAVTNVADIKQQQNVLVASAQKKLLSADLEPVPAQSSNSDLTPPTITGTYLGEPGEYKILIKSNTNSSDNTLRTFGIENFEGVVGDDFAEPLGTKGLFIELPEGQAGDYVDTIWYLSLPNTQGANYTQNLTAYNTALENRTVAIREAERSLSQGSGANSIAMAELDQARARESRILAQIEEHTIRAPFDGVVSGVSGEVGEIASAGSEIISIVSGGSFEITLEVPEIDVSKLETGDDVRVMLDAFSGTEMWQGVIQAISQAETFVDGVPVYETTVRFINPDERVRSGMSATVSIVTETRTNVPAIPAEFIERDEDGLYVTLQVSEDTKERRDIVTGLRGSDGMVEILSGLVLGDTIFTVPENSRRP